MINLKNVFKNLGLIYKSISCQSKYQQIENGFLKDQENLQNDVNQTMKSFNKNIKGLFTL